MKNKKIIFLAFAALVLLAPLYVMFSSQAVLGTGKLYKFKSETRDPFDPFRGNYLTVSYDTWDIPTKSEFKIGDRVYLLIGLREDGFAYFKKAYKSPPAVGDYVESTVSRTRGMKEDLENSGGMFRSRRRGVQGGRKSVSTEAPNHMGKYYINEDYAMKAENEFERRRNDSYIAVRVKNGSARVEDIYIHKKPIMKYLEDLN